MHLAGAGISKAFTLAKDCYISVSAMAKWPIGKVRVRVKLHRRREKRRNGNTTKLLITVD